MPIAYMHPNFITRFYFVCARPKIDDKFTFHLSDLTDMLLLVSSRNIYKRRSINVIYERRLNVLYWMA